MTGDDRQIDFQDDDDGEPIRVSSSRCEAGQAVRGGYAGCASETHTRRERHEQSCSADVGHGFIDSPEAFTGRRYAARSMVFTFDSRHGPSRLAMSVQSTWAVNRPGFFGGLIPFARPPRFPVRFRTAKDTRTSRRIPLRRC